jgi:hypothetical protein
MFSRSVNEAPRVIRMKIIGDATTCRVILMTLELSFTIVMFIIQATENHQVQRLKILAKFKS